MKQEYIRDFFTTEELALLLEVFALEKKRIEKRLDSCPYDMPGTEGKFLKDRSYKVSQLRTKICDPSETGRMS